MEQAVGNNAKKQKKQSYYDYSMLILVLIIVAFGLVMIYSSSSYTAQVHEEYNYDDMFFLKKQLFACGIGIVVMLGVSMFDYRLLIKKIIGKVNLAWVVYLAAIFLQAFVLLSGRNVNGATRWLKIGGLSVQPSEITKVAIIIFVSYIIYCSPKIMNKPTGLLKVAIYCALPIGLVIKENLSSAIVIGALMICICYVASKKKWYYIVVMAIAFLGVYIYIMTGDSFREGRLEIWLDVENHPDGDQIRQGLYAIASGGLFGTGLGRSMQKLGFLPEAYNDMIFSIVCEELGFFGALVLILLFVLLIWRIAYVALHAPDIFGSLLCVGVLAHVAVQVIMNIAVVTNSIPSTGIPMPFISYGGTSLLILLAEMGMVLSVSNKIEY